MAETKICARCKESKNVERFSLFKRGEKQVLRSYCMLCCSAVQKAAFKKHYPQKVQLRRALAIKAMSEGCVDCGVKDIRVLDFDHVQGVKKFPIGAAVISANRSLAAIEKEIAKCEVRCANCHRIRHALENNTWRNRHRDQEDGLA